MSKRSKFENLSNLLYAILIYRQSVNCKQTHLAREIGMTQKQYSQIENGKAGLKLRVFLQISHILRKNPCDLLEQSGLLKEFPTCEKTNLINELRLEIKELKNRNMLLEMLFQKLPDK